MKGADVFHSGRGDFLMELAEVRAQGCLLGGMESRHGRADCALRISAPPSILPTAVRCLCRAAQGGVRLGSSAAAR